MPCDGSILKITRRGSNFLEEPLGMANFAALQPTPEIICPSPKFITKIKPFKSGNWTGLVPTMDFGSKCN